MDSDNSPDLSSSFICQLTLPWDLAPQYLSPPSYSQHLLLPSRARTFLLDIQVCDIQVLRSVCLDSVIFSDAPPTKKKRKHVVAAIGRFNYLSG